mmetsp:Transcript_51350/g.133432  ORF Transcript_51350/g.133432 Transcript_51350/m.133432 type:complete len:215 (+) Transcript_51350:856-1500(+)
MSVVDEGTAEPLHRHRVFALARPLATFGCLVRLNPQTFGVGLLLALLVGPREAEDLAPDGVWLVGKGRLVLRELEAEQAHVRVQADRDLAVPQPRARVPVGWAVVGAPFGALESRDQHARQARLVVGGLANMVKETETQTFAVRRRPLVCHRLFGGRKGVQAGQQDHVLIPISHAVDRSHALQRDVDKGATIKFFIGWIQLVKARVDAKVQVGR